PLLGENGTRGGAPRERARTRQPVPRRSRTRVADLGQSFRRMGGTCPDRGRPGRRGRRTYLAHPGPGGVGRIPPGRHRTGRVATTGPGPAHRRVLRLLGPEGGSVESHRLWTVGRSASGHGEPTAHRGTSALLGRGWRTRCGLVVGPGAGGGVPFGVGPAHRSSREDAGTHPGRDFRSFAWV